MNASFLGAVHFVLKHECVYAAGHEGDLAHVVTENVPGDGGGLTKYGIDQASHPHVNIRGLTLDGAVAIYRDEEWRKCRCDDLPAGIDAAVFDCAVNNGMGTAIRMLQGAVNAVLKTEDKEIAVDSHIGPATVQAVKEAALAPASALLRKFLAMRQALYFGIVGAHPGDKKFLQGWLGRNNDLARYVGIDPAKL